MPTESTRRPAPAALPPANRRTKPLPHEEAALAQLAARATVQAIEWFHAATALNVEAHEMTSTLDPAPYDMDIGICRQFEKWQGITAHAMCTARASLVECIQSFRREVTNCDTLGDDLPYLPRGVVYRGNVYISQADEDKPMEPYYDVAVVPMSAIVDLDAAEGGGM